MLYYQSCSPRVLHRIRYNAISLREKIALSRSVLWLLNLFFFFVDRTLTCLLLDMSVATRQQRLFEGFVEVCFCVYHPLFDICFQKKKKKKMLLEIMSKCNNPLDAALRSTACECLTQLEMAYPGLFSQVIGNFLVFAQTEVTFAHQSYLSLFLVCLENAARLVSVTSRRTLTLSDSSTSHATRKVQILVPRAMVPFVIPNVILGSDSTEALPSLGIGGAGSDTGLPDSCVNEIRKAIKSLVVEASTHCSPVYLYRFVVALYDLYRVCGADAVSPDLFRLYFFRLLDSGSPLLIASVLLIRKWFPALFESGEMVSNLRLMQKLHQCGHDIGSRPEQRAMALALISEFGSWCDGPDKSSLFALSSDLFWPSVFDDWSMARCKLLTLVNCFSPAHPSPHNLLQALSVVSEFRLHPPEHPLPRLVFAVLKRVLQHLPEQFDHVYRFLLDVVVYTPGLIPNLLSIVTPRNLMSDRLIGQLNQLLCSLEPVQLVSYIALVEQICCVPTVDPTQLLGRLLSCLDELLKRRLALKSSIGAEARSMEWNFGDSLLRVYTCALVVQSPSRLSVWSPVCQGLQSLWSLYPDLEIRDRAHHLWCLATRCPPEKAASLLHGPEDQLTAITATLSGEPTPMPPPLRVPKFLLLQPLARRKEEPHGRLPTSGDEPNWDSFIENYPPKEGDDESHHRTMRMGLRFMDESEISTREAKRRTKLSNNNTNTKAARAFEAQTPSSSMSKAEFMTPSPVSSSGVAASAASNFPGKPRTLVGATITVHPGTNCVARNPTIEVPLLREGDTFEFDLTVAVLQPLPVKLRCTIEFSCAPLPDATPQGWGDCILCATSTLGRIKWAVEALFCPIPRNPSPLIKKRLFETYWTGLASREMYGESVRRIVADRDAVLHSLRTSLLSAFVVEWVEEAVARLVIFLPPRYHLLLEFRIPSLEDQREHSHSCVVSIRTDFWPMLAQIDTYIDGAF